MDDIPEYGAVILVTPDDQIVLQLRDDKPDIVDPNCLSLFAGRLEADETPEEGARRELFEETTLKPKNLEFFMTYHAEKQRLGYQARSHVFIARGIDPLAVDVREGQGYRLIRDAADLQKHRFSLISQDILRAYFDQKQLQTKETPRKESLSLS